MKFKIPTLARWGAVALLAGTLVGCGGSSDNTTPAAGGGGVPAAPGVTAPTGTAPVNLTALSAAQIAALTPAVTVGGVTIASPPVVTFAISDGAATDNAILGVTTSQVRFMLAKLVPGTDGAPSKWVSYGVLNSAGDGGQRPNAERNGTLVDNGDGTYTYTFANDITMVKDAIAALTFTAPESAADLGDLTYDPTLTHRLVIQMSGGGLDRENPVNAVYDFIPATGQPVAATDFQRQVVSIDSCNQCHEKLAFHGGGRIDTQYCVTCHTDQRKFGRERVTSTALAFPALTETAEVNATTGITSYDYEPDTYVADGEVSGNFTTLIHKIHQGHSLVKQNYHYAGIAFNNKGFSMLGDGQKMCVVCHDNTKAAQADNWNAVPTRLACGACHDGIDFATGAGTTLGGLTTGHVGKAQSNDGTCALCHGAADIKVYHQTVNLTEHNPTTPTGLVNFTYEIKSAAVDAANDLTIMFKISADGTALTALPPTGFTGSPSFRLAYATNATATDGIASPVDFTNAGGENAQPISAGISSATGPDSSGYFTLVVPSASAFPVGATMRTVALQGYYTQAAGTGGIASNTARHTVSAVATVTGDTARRAVIDPAKCSNCHEWFEGHGGNRVQGPESTSSVCLVCHVPGIASSGRTISDGELAGYTFSASDVKLLADWKFDKTLPNAALKFPAVTNNLKDMLHGVHIGRERVTPFMTARNALTRAITLLDFRRLDFPGRINNCETCHISGTYASVPTGALPSTYEYVDTTYAATPTTANALAAWEGSTAVTGTDRQLDKVTSPFTAACISCHDSSAAQGHMATNGGMIQVTRATFATNMATPGGGEACATCHGAGKAEDVTVKHK